MRLDDFLPAYHFHEVHSIRVHAAPDRVFRAVKAVTAREIRLLGLLLGIRSLPARLLGKSRPASGEDAPILNAMARSGFLLLAEEADGEMVLGTIGRFWKPAGNKPVKIADAQQFLAFEHPGYAKVAMNFRVEDEGPGSSKVSTETRILATDPAARRKFALYWSVIHTGSALIRRMWLRAVKKRAEA